MKHIIVFLLFTLAAAAQPHISSGGVVNIASAAPDGLPNSGIAQGSIFMVSGTGLGAANPNPINLFQSTVYPLPTSDGLSGTTIQFQAQGGQGPISAQGPVYAIMLYESPTMLAAILPSPTGIGTYTVTVTYNGQSSQPSTPVHVVTQAFGLFTLSNAFGTPGYGTGPGLVEEQNSSGNFVVNGFRAPATPGQTVLLFGTGLGAISGDETQGPAASGINGLVELGVLIGGQLAGYNPSQDYIGRFLDPSAGLAYAGVDIIELQIPQNVQGCFVSIAVIANGVVSNMTTLAIDPSGTSCSDSAIGYSAADFQSLYDDQMARIGTVTLTDVIAIGTSVRSDTAGATFVNLTANQFNGLPSQNVSAGGCIVATANANGPSPPPGLTGTPLDAGPVLNLSGPDGPIGIAQGAALAYSTVANANNLPMIDPGSYNLNDSSGGANVGSFQGSFNVPAAPDWTNAGAIALIGVPTNANMTVTWSGGDPNSLIQILGLSADVNSGLEALFVCNAPSSAGQFTLPGYVLSWLPVTNSSVGVMVVSNVGLMPFQAPGLEVGYLTYDIGTALAVQYSSGVGGLKELRQGTQSSSFFGHRSREAGH